jgi:hypothetical protein
MHSMNGKRSPDPSPSQTRTIAAGHALTGGRIKGEYDTLTGRGAPDLHRQLYRSVRRSAFGGGDRRIHLRGRSSRRLGAEKRWRADAIAPGTELEVQVREPATCHRLTVQQIRRWCDGVAVSPDETLKKRRLKQLLA